MSLLDQRVMQTPAQGIVTPAPPTRDHQQYPKHMRHPGYAPATVGDEVKSPHGFTYYRGGTSQRYPPVLVGNEIDEQYHLSQGYEVVGSCSPESFARLVQQDMTVIEGHEPIEYPKWVNGKLVKSAEEEARLTGQPVPGSSEAAGEAPALDTEVNTLTVFTPPVESKEDKRARLLRELAELEDEPLSDARRVVIDAITREAAATASEPGLPTMKPTEEQRDQAGDRFSQQAAELAAKKAAHAAKVKAGIAKKKAERAAETLKKAQADVSDAE
jgi:hypothetical protein